MVAPSPLYQWADARARAYVGLRRFRKDEPQPATILDWAKHHRRIDGQPFALDRFPPLQAIYADDHPRIVVMKPAQRGVSEWAINLTGFALDRGAETWATNKDGLNVAYLFPTQGALSDFSKERFGGLRHESESLASVLGDGDFDAVTFKQVGRSYLYLRGAWSETALLSFAADVLILDEYDRMDPKAIALARRRLNASVVKREVAISTPTLPGVGIHGLYLRSDQRVYEQVCPSCGAWSVVDFFRDVWADGAPFDTWQRWPEGQLQRAAFAVHCPACREPWSDEARAATGRWTALEPDASHLHGYHIPALAFPFVDLREFAIRAVSLDPSERQEFHRSDIGVPYEEAGARITEAMLAQLAAALPGGELPRAAWRDVTMGVDVGARFHYRVSGAGPDEQRYVLAMGTVGSWDELDMLLVHHGVRRCVIDAMPELHACQAWAEKHPGIVLRALYPAASALAGLLFRVREDDAIVQINRTMALDRLYAVIAKGAERWPVMIARDPDVVAHLTASVRVTRTDDRGQEVAEWVHTKPDHYAHSALYDLLAGETLPQPPETTETVIHDSSISISII